MTNPKTLQIALVNMRPIDLALVAATLWSAGHECDKTLYVEAVVQDALALIAEADAQLRAAL